MAEKSKSQKQEREELTLTFKPSARRRTASQPGELNQLPVMNLMIILIPVLLAQSAAVKLALHEVNLPTGRGAGGSAATEEVQKEEEQLSLTVNITRQGFDIISAFGREKTKGTTVPLKNDEYDYVTLNEKLMDIKKQIEKSGIHFVDAGNVIVMGEPGIKYDVIVHVMDAAKWGENEEGGRISLFPGILLSPGKVQVQ
ncbi:MAG: hypothetical protein DRP97_01445 [Candidatus Latescibacterota bacterium]|nr:hypothetical protein [Candidatus Latescibacterota bacterium]RKY71855.1 MAG: hypothetical protein DRP97_01445 [Candidatus Latescibacterota bacterium]